MQTFKDSCVQEPCGRDTVSIRILAGGLRAESGRGAGGL